MQTEVENAAKFWINYIPDSSLASDKKEALRKALVEVLLEKYMGHWHIERTMLGSAYRSISNWRGLDTVLVKAAHHARISVDVLERWLPRDQIMWCDPYSVTYRVGDHGSVLTFYEDKHGLLEIVKKSVAEKVSRPGSDFVISAYTTPVVIRSADGVEISRRGGSNSAGPSAGGVQGLHASPTKGANDLRRSAMSPLRQVSSYRSSVTDSAPPRWSTPSS
ncbi:hypothetical protein GGH12_006088 [Coemansia sp. RSA 1822]|nr:hypothetical protein LPJ76_006196 [Coemansia sp. RSA 638]KAJ2124830.1 hypothetical protein IW147_001435 [Coemansia sp. RSA 720]KAJ2557810.1 hypothetical protein GGH12_006088 [Coemansia sp. RSA 1822]KAJ2659303.1 hypothetical protein IW148_004316 [Coemansia sp. RSA 1199]